MKLQSRMAGTREDGALLLELMVALSVLLVGLLGVMSTFACSFKATREVVETDEVRSAMEDLTETLRGWSFRDIYSRYNGTTVEVPSLKGGNGGSASIAIRCHVNELALPAEFGPVLDLDDSGALDNADCSLVYMLLPVQLTLSYMSEHAPETNELFLILRG